MADLAPEIEVDDPLFVSKRALANVHGCELKHMAERSADFAWNATIARGSVAHKAIELSVHWRGEPDPLDMVDEALARLADGSDGLATWLQGCPEGERAELRALANERVVTFFECFPPAQGPLGARHRGPPAGEPAWAVASCCRAAPTSRSAVPSGTTAGKVIIDLKTGGFSPSHLDDLRFYAMVETLRLGTPPRLLASYYLDSGRAHPEAVTEGLLHAAVARTVDGARILHQLEVGTREPVVRPGRACRWCPALAGCGPGRAHLGEDDLLDDRLDDD